VAVVARVVVAQVQVLLRVAVLAARVRAGIQVLQMELLEYLVRAMQVAMVMQFFNLHQVVVVAGQALLEQTQQSLRLVMAVSVSHHQSQALVFTMVAAEAEAVISLPVIQLFKRAQVARAAAVLVDMATKCKALRVQMV
jgi:hypothetical protein